VPVRLWRCPPAAALTRPHHSAEFARAGLAATVLGPSPQTGPAGLPSGSELRRPRIHRDRAPPIAMQVPAGGAWPLNRWPLQHALTAALERNPLDHRGARASSAALPDANEICVLATGRPPAMSSRRAGAGCSPAGTTAHFFDCRQPDRGREASAISGGLRRRGYDKGDADYINCPMRPCGNMRPSATPCLAAEQPSLKRFRNRERHLFRRLFLAEIRGAGPPAATTPCPLRGRSNRSASGIRALG